MVMDDFLRVFPRQIESLSRSPIGAQLFEGAGFDGSPQAVWVEQTGLEWVMAWFVRGEPELACVWEKSLDGGLGPLAQLWGGALADGLARGSQDEAQRAKTLFFTFQMQANGLRCENALSYSAWRPVLALKLASQLPGGGFSLSAQEEAALDAIDDLLQMRPALRRPSARAGKGKAARRKGAGKEAGTGKEASSGAEKKRAAGVAAALDGPIEPEAPFGV